MIQNLRLLSVKDLAKVLAISVRTVWRLRSAGKLPSPVLVDSSCRWVERDIERWINLGCPGRQAFEAQVKAEGQ